MTPRELVVFQFRGSLDGNYDQVSSTRSVGVTLVRRFNAGERVVSCPRRVATIDFTKILELSSAVATRREYFR
ncbi:MAG: hypothetical protein DMF75_19605 [Acidobacteria bacterium]|nr:MAG: hypothetical protein DMF75_19605 [Acidobacteriota bacterium]